MKIQLLIPLIAIVASILGCVSPPRDLQSSVIDNREALLISTVKRGKDYALSGRMTLAEQEFREALKMNPRLASVYSDLGYVLQGQNRLHEASEMFQKSLLLEPNNIATRDHLARTYYKLGLYSDSLEQFQRLISLQYGITSGDLPLASSKALSTVEMASVYRNVAMLNYAVGYLDEAVCYSGLALDRGANLYETVQHERLLLSLERVNDALPVIRGGVVAGEGKRFPELMLDYGIALYTLKQFQQADESFTRMLSIPSASYEDRRVAKVLKMLIASQKRGMEEIKNDLSTLIEENPTACAEREVFDVDYWPQVVVEDVSRFIEEVCDGGIQPVVES